MPRKTPGSYRVTPEIEAAYAGGPVVCLAIQARGRSYRLHADRPAYVRARDAVLAPRADAIGPDGMPIDVDPAGSPILSRVSIVGALETSAGYHDECGGWSDGYDAISERMCAALVEGDVLLMIDSPGGAVIGLQECVDAILACKAQFGRRITVIIGAGMAASAGYWLAATLADPGELYITRSSMAGSIGARSAHCNEEGALMIAGVAITDFAYPAGKIAMSPNRAPTATGIARGERDVMAAFEAFAAAVSTARPMLSRKAIVRLDADMLTGAAAVTAGLADAVAPIEDVERWALYRASTPGEETMSDPKVTAEGEETPPPKKPGEEAAKAGCAKCGEGMPDEARYCAKCGARAGAEFPPAKDDEDEEEPESSKTGARLAQGSTVAALLGLRADASEPAVRLAVSALLSEVRYVRGIVGATSLDGVKGKLRAMVEDVATGARAAVALKKERAANETRERKDLLLALCAAEIPGCSRGDLIEDVLGADAAGAEIITGIKPKSGNPIANAPIADLRAYAAGKLANAQPVERSPFEPSEEAAKAPIDAARTKALADDPAVKQAVAAGVKLEDAIAIHQREFSKTPTLGAIR